jgi:hypothetical protein
VRREFLIKACTYQIQVKAFGGLSVATKNRLRAIAEGARTGEAVPISGSLKIRSQPGCAADPLHHPVTLRNCPRIRRWESPVDLTTSEPTHRPG